MPDVWNVFIAGVIFPQKKQRDETKALYFPTATREDGKNILSEAFKSTLIIARRQ